MENINKASPIDQNCAGDKFEEIIGNSTGLKFVLTEVQRVAPTDSTVLVLGETGSGKERIAEAIHKASTRRDRPFIKLNCAAIPFDLLESELFGYEKGAFTGAFAQRIGRFEMADSGTLFLDEIGDIPLALQPKLLRVLQEKEFERLGSGKTHHIDVRLVVATHRNLEEMVARNQFRSDLYYRLNVVPIDIPPLREHKEDIPDLAKHFLARFGRENEKQIDGLTPAAIKTLLDYHWPGNVRQLENAIERAVALTANKVLDASDFQLDAGQSKSNASSSGSFLPEGATLEQWEDEIIREALRRANGNKSQAARLLGLSRNALRYRLAKIGVPDDTE